MLRSPSPRISAFPTGDTPLGRHRNHHHHRSPDGSLSFASVTPPSSRRHYRANKFGFGSEASTSFDDPSLVSGYGLGGGDSRNGSPTTTARRVRVSDQDLRLRAALVRNSVDFDAITDLSRNRWAWRESHREFSLFSIDADAERRHEVLAAGDLNCSIEEVESVLHATGVADFNTTMKGLLDKEFIFGSVVHALTGEGDGAAALFSPALGREQTTTSPLTPSESRKNYVAVKTSAFARSKMFARNEEWCFLESFDRSPSGDCVLLSQSTMDAAEVGAGKAPHSRVDQLRDITTALYVEKLPSSRRGVRVFFHGKYDGGLLSFLNAKGAASPKTSKTRLMVLARGVSRISDLVRRRRLGIQKMANRAALNATKNAFCTCCTKSLHVFTKKKRCYLCAYYVCDKCWSEQKMETCNGKTSSILICTRCLESVDACEYSGVFAESKKERKHLIRVEPDDGDDGSSPVRTSTNTTSSNQKHPTGKALVDILAQTLSGSNEVAKAATMSVIRHILALEKSSGSKKKNAPPSQSPAERSPEPQTPMNSSVRANRDHVKELERCFSLSSEIPIADCVLASAETRSYPIHMPANPRVSVPDYPVPANEAWRLRVIDANSFLALGEVAELNVICALAAETLQCAISMVTIIDQETEHILSCNNPELHRTRMARNQTFCSHLIMDAKPLLIRHPEADVRFHAMDAVTKSGVRFYCGFPLRARDGTVVGSVCCLDFQQRALTQSQYSLMEKLAQTASSVVQTKGSALSEFRGVRTRSR